MALVAMILASRAAGIWTRYPTWH